MAYRKIQQDRINKGLCKNCGQPRSGTAKVYCSNCIKKAKPLIDARRRKLREAGLREDCGDETKGNRVHCEICLFKQRTTKTAWQKRVPHGFCTICGKRKCLPELVNAKLHMKRCQECYLRHASAVQLGTSKYWTTLLIKLEQQQWCCTYSGDEIVLGVNDSMDHIIPKSKKPNLAKDPSNIQWVTRVVNRIKSNLTHSEFISLARCISDRFPEH